MGKEKLKERIEKLYNDGNGMTPSEISKEIGISYNHVYFLTAFKKKINPETWKPFESSSEYKSYRERRNIKKNFKFSELVRRRLIELGKSQTWLAEKLGVSRQAVLYYVRGISKPRAKRFYQLMHILDVDPHIELKSLEDLIDNDSWEIKIFV